jgi:hypothetical protein
MKSPSIAGLQGIYARKYPNENNWVWHAACIIGDKFVPMKKTILLSLLMQAAVYVLIYLIA